MPLTLHLEADPGVIKSGGTVVVTVRAVANSNAAVTGKLRFVDPAAAITSAADISIARLDDVGGPHTPRFKGKWQGTCTVTASASGIYKLFVAGSNGSHTDTDAAQLTVTV